MTRPQPHEHNPYFAKYIGLVPGNQIVRTLHAQTERLMPFWRGIPENAPHPEGKWSLKQVMNHITDTERIFAYRALRIGRGDETPLPGFEQDPFVANAGAEARTWQSLVDEHELVRRSTLVLLETFPAAAWERIGTASGGAMSLRALAYVIAGHELHHEAILRSSYGIGTAPPV